MLLFVFARARRQNWLEAQKHQIPEFGYENYFAQQIHE